MWLKNCKNRRIMTLCMGPDSLGTLNQNQWIGIETLAAAAGWNATTPGTLAAVSIEFHAVPGSKWLNNPTITQHQPMRSSVSQPSNKIQDHSQAPNPQTEMWHEEVAEIQPQVPEGGQDPQQVPKPTMWEKTFTRVLPGKFHRKLLELHACLETIWWSNDVQKYLSPRSRSQVGIKVRRNYLQVREVAQTWQGSLTHSSSLQKQNSKYTPIKPASQNPNPPVISQSNRRWWSPSYKHRNHQSFSWQLIEPTASNSQQ